MTLLRRGTVERPAAQDFLVLAPSGGDPHPVLADPHLRRLGIRRKFGERPQRLRRANLPEAPGGFDLMAQPGFGARRRIASGMTPRQRGQQQQLRNLHGRKNAPSIKQLSCSLSLI